MVGMHSAMESSLVLLFMARMLELAIHSSHTCQPRGHKSLPTSDVFFLYHLRCKVLKNEITVRE